MAKGEIYKAENEMADSIKDSEKNEQYGFRCLHYSVSEGAGSIRIHILNKQKKPGKVRAITIDKEAKAGDDYEKVDKVISFNAG